MIGLVIVEEEEAGGEVGPELEAEGESGIVEPPVEKAELNALRFPALG